MKFYIGCSGFYYKEWKNIFYPARLPPKDWFRYYCAHFNTVEINSTFYRTPSSASLEKWYRDSPEGFLFSVKAPRNITHLSRFRITRGEIDAFYQLISAGLQEKLGNPFYINQNTGKKPCRACSLRSDMKRSRYSFTSTIHGGMPLSITADKCRSLYLIRG